MRPQTFNSSPLLLPDETFGPGRPGLLRKVNAAEILRLVRQCGPCSRTDLARASGLSVPTVSSSIEYLRKKGLVEAMGTGGSSGGRPPALVRFNRSYGYVVGVDIGGSAVRVALADLDGGVVGKVNLAIRARGTPGRVVAMIRSGVSRLRRAHGVARKKLLAIAVGAPGITDLRAGTVRSAPHLAGWENVPLQELVSEGLELPTAIENDVNLGALGESWCGTARGVPDFVFIGIGTGVGAGVFLEGHLYHGASWMAGEIGYLMVPGTRSGPLDVMQSGPLESVVGGRGIEQAWRQANHRRQALQATEILDRAEAGDPLARSILDRTARVLAEGIMNLSMVLNPQLLVFGGRIGTHPTLFRATEHVVERSRVATPRLAKSILGQEAQLLGAVRLATQVAEARLLGGAVRRGEKES